MTDLVEEMLKIQERAEEARAQFLESQEEAQSKDCEEKQDSAQSK